MNEVQETSKNEVYTLGTDEEKWGATVDTQDILMPRLLLMQSNSDFVDQGLAANGEIFHSLHEKPLGGKGEMVNVVIFDSFKTVQTFELAKGETKAKWIRTEPWTAELAAIPYSSTDLDTDIEVLTKTVHNFYALLPNEIENNVAFPVVISFKGSSVNTAKKLGTYLKQGEALNQASCSFVYGLTSHQEIKDDNKFYVFDITKNRVSTSQEVQTCKLWWDTTRKATVTIHEDEKE